jgi:hypothetical protein
MDADELQRLLGSARGVRHACDLDLLLFFHRHPMSLLTSEQLVASVGYERERVAQSLEGLIDAGYLTRSQNRTHAARLYILQTAAVPTGPALAALLQVGSTRQGRQALLALLYSDPSSDPEPVQSRYRAPVVKIDSRERLSGHP